jgi:hypothetical protein
MCSFPLTDFIPIYPSQNEPDFQYLITAKKEFNELETSSEERLIGKLFRHQKMISRYMREYERLLLIHEAGTGKTCTFVSITEFYRLHSNLYKKAYILERNEPTKNDFQRQIMNICAKGQFEKEKHMKEWYNVTTYDKFIRNDLGLSELIKDKSGTEITLLELEHAIDLISEQFSECIFLIDEAHNFRNSNKEVEELIEEERVDETAEDQAIFSPNSIFSLRIQIFKMLFRKAKRIKVVISTATPMINSPAEIRPFFNLLLDQDLPEYINENSSTKELEPYLRGKVSYIRALDTGIDVSFVGLPRSEINNEELKSKINVVPLCVVGNQKSVMQKTHEDRGNFRNNQITASTFVFPFENASSAIHINTDLVNTKEYKFLSQIKFNYQGKDLTLREYVSDFNRLKNLSIKFAFIIKNELRYAFSQGFLKDSQIKDLKKKGIDFDMYENFELGENNQPIQAGNAFIYTSNIKNMGAIMLGLIMQEYGFSIYTGNTRSPPHLEPVISKGLRIAIFAESFGNIQKSAIDVFSNNYNYKGEYIQCIIGTRMSRDGINLPNSSRFYMAVPEWHYSGTYQAMSRIIRSTSHEELKKYQDGRVQVNIYFLCAICERNVNIGDVISVDNDIYKSNEEKDKAIAEVMRKLKRISFDCILNYRRNVRLSDKNDSRDCDYQECQYQCISARSNPDGLANGQGPTKDEYDFSTYNILYSDEMTDKARQIIIDKVKKNGNTTFDEVIEIFSQKLKDEGLSEFKDNDIELYVYKAVEKQVSSKVSFPDTYGYRCYLQTDDTNIFIQRDIPRKNLQEHGTIGIYNLQLIGYERQPLSSIKRYSVQSSTIIEQILKYPVKTEKQKETVIKEFAKWCNYEKHILISTLEEMFVKNYIEKFNHPVIKFLTEEYYGIYVCVLNKPDQAIKNFNSLLSSKKRFNEKNVLQESNLTEDPSNHVIIHFLFKKESATTRNIFYRVTQINPKDENSQLRVYESQEGVWRNATRSESIVYSYYFYCKYMDNLKQLGLEEGEVYAIYNDYDHNDISLARYYSEDAKGDTRKHSRGGKCSTLQIETLREYAYELGISFEDKNKDTLCDEISRTLEDDGKYIYHPPINPIRSSD